MLAKLWTWIKRNAWNTTLMAIALAYIVWHSLATLLRYRDRRTDDEWREQMGADGIARDAAKSERERSQEARQRAEVAQDSADEHAIRAHEAARSARRTSGASREQLARELREKLRKGGTYAIFFCALSSPVASVNAADSLRHPDTAIEGWWMDDAEHAESVAWLAELVELRLAFSDQKRAAYELRNALDSELAASAICDASLRASTSVVRMQEKRIASLDAWWRRPAVVGGVSFAIGVIATGAITIAVSR